MTFEYLIDFTNEVRDLLIGSWSLVIQTLSLTFADLVNFINSLPGWSVSEWLLTWLTTAEITLFDTTLVLGEISILSLVLGTGLMLTICISVIKWIIGIIT